LCFKAVSAKEAVVGLVEVEDLERQVVPEHPVVPAPQVHLAQLDSLEALDLEVKADKEVNCLFFSKQFGGV
jgi:hypothetical protein